jgi:predicted NBD/HSP70 family sugar kinase
VTSRKVLIAGSGQAAVGVAASAGHILQLLRSHTPGYSRAALLDITGMARSTLYERLDALFAAGLVYESRPLRSGRGRPPRAVLFDDRDKLVLAIEIGQTLAGIHLLSLRHEVTASAQLPVDVSQPLETVMGTILEACCRLLAGRSPVGVGVSMPAPVDPLHRMGLERTVLAHWDLQRLQDLIEAKLDCPILVENDARSMASGEVRNPLESLVAIKVSTGVGCGIVVRGALVRGAHGAAGDIGHVRIPEAAGRRCRCGRDGCLAAVASGRAFLADPKFAHYRSLQHFVDAYDSDPAVRSAVVEAGRIVGRVLSATVGTLNPDRLAFGGMIGILPDFVQACREQIREDAFEPSLVDLEIGPADSPLATAIGLSKLVGESLYAPDRIGQLLLDR